jgi:hypothetical protein
VDSSASIYPCAAVSCNPCTIPEMHIFPPDGTLAPQTSLLPYAQPLYDVVLGKRDGL